VFEKDQQPIHIMLSSSHDEISGFMVVYRSALANLLVLAQETIQIGCSQFTCSRTRNHFIFTCNTRHMY